MKKNILLSICIPTYNRSGNLSKTIDSIVLDPAFLSGNIEIAISDNASTDNTESVVQKYCEKYSNITYHRNLTNNGFMNFITVLDLAQGQLCKVNNDYTLFKKDALSKLFSLAMTTQEFKPQIFLGYGVLKRCAVGEYETFDEFLSAISYWCTFVGGFCIWKNDYEALRGIEINKMFPHTTLLLALTDKKKYIINNDDMFQSQTVSSKGGYNVFNVFAVQFLNMLSENRKNKSITVKTFNTIRKDLFLKFMVPWYYNTKVRKNDFTFELTGIKESIKVYYSKYHYFILVFLAHLYSLRSIPAWISRLLRK